MFCNVIKLPSNFALTIGWMCLWWTGLRVLFLFFLNSYLTLLQASVKSIAPFLHYIYSVFLTDKNDSNDGIEKLVFQLKKLISCCFYLLCVDAVFQISLIYASNKKSFMLMLPWLVYSFMTLIFFTIMPLDYYSREPSPDRAPNGELVESGIFYAIEQMFTYFIYLTIQLILLLVVFDNFQKLRCNRGYYYLKNAIDTEKKMVYVLLDLCEEAIIRRFKSKLNKKHGISLDSSVNGKSVKNPIKFTIDEIHTGEKVSVV